MNVGFHIAMNDSSINFRQEASEEEGRGHWNCLIFHDLDMLPMSLENIYKCGTKVSIPNVLDG